MHPLWVQGSTQIPTFVLLPFTEVLLRQCLADQCLVIMRLSFADFYLWGVLRHTFLMVYVSETIGI